MPYAASARRRWAELVVLLAALGAAAPPAGAAPPRPDVPRQAPTSAPAAKPGAPERALELHDEARALYAQGRYRDAVAALEEALALDPDAKLLYYNLGLIEEKLGELDAALANYRKCLELEPNPEERVKIATIIKRIEGAKVHAARASERPAPAAAEAEGDAPRAATAADRSVSPWVFVTGALAISAVGVGAALASRAANLDPGGQLRTSPDMPLERLQSDAAEAHDYAIGADVAFVVAGVAAVVTVVLALWPAGDEGSAASRRPLSVRF